MDPFHPDKVGLPFAKDVADIVTVSHSHDDHNAVELVTGPVTRSSTFVVDSEGEYEIGGVEITATKMYHDKLEGAERGKNIIVNIRMDGINVLHLGDLGHKLTESQIEKIGDVDVLMISVGRKTALENNEVMDLISDIAPSYVVPMHFKKEELEDLGTLLARVLAESKYICFLTVGDKENRSWLIKQNTTAWEAAGAIHSDIQQGFIRAEIISFADFIACGGETQSKQAGKMRLEQKDYVMQDGDLANFRFNK